jgi:hypothetical protein
VSSAFTIREGIAWTLDWYEDTFRWRQEEYRTLSSLHGGISIAKMEEVLGSPLFVRNSEDNSGLTEKTFQGRDYWVQAIHDEEGTVRLLAITSCDDDFRPKFETPSGGSVVLNESTFDSLKSDPTSIEYDIPGATGNMTLLDEYYDGNPGLYKTYFLGISDACPAVANYLLNLRAGGPLPDALYFDYAERTPYESGLAFVDEFRSESIVNTYAETAPLVGRGGLDEPSEYRGTFQVGADRLLVRTVQPDRVGGYPEGYLDCIRHTRSDDSFEACAHAFSTR